MFQNPWYGQAGLPGAAEDANHGDAHGSPPSAARPEPSQEDNQQPDDSTARPDILQLIQQRLKPGWTVHLNQDGRLFYCNHVNQTSSWLPPIENWAGGVAANTPALPYGWEAAVDREGKPYFINHLNKTTTYEDPRKDWAEEPPQPRQVILQRHPELGFGFVAGSEKPVIVRFVTEGGPSVDKLLPGDQVWQINGEDVRTAPRDHVIQLVRSCKESVQLTVCQPPVDTTGRKSALLSAAKKAKLKSNPSRVRFAEGVVINGSALPAAQAYAKDGENSVPLMPNVMKVYLENGQTKSFKYDSATTVSDVLASLQQKLGFKSMDHFSLCVEHVKSLRRNKLTLLDPSESLAWIAARPGSHNLRCLLRVAFVPKDSYDMLRKDTGAFEYLYMQCCNDVVQERFAPELKYDIALRLAALHMYQHAMSNKMQAKITVKNIEQEYGLERFVPLSLVEAMKRKELRKLLSHFFKVNGQLTAPGQKQLTALQAKLHYLKIIAELPSYGAKCFSTNFKDSNVESVILISPKYGISHISGLRNSNPVSLCNIEDVTSLNVRREDELTEHVEIRLKDPDKETLQLGLEEKEAEELILVLRGYHKLLADRVLPVHREKNRWTEDSAPPYHTRHTVEYSPWSFLTGQRPAPDTGRRVRFADFSIPPPYHPPPEDFHIPDGSYPPYVEEDFEAEAEDPEARGVALSLSPQVNVDSNMNKAVPNNNVSRSLFFGKRSSTLETAIPGHKLGFDMPSVVSMEILEAQRDCSEARNDAVIQRVSEMKRLVEESEQYLTDDVRHPEADTASLMSEVSQLSKTESDASSAYGKLRHSDSLLLLTQGQKQLSLPDNSTILIDATEPSSSDTDTPNATPTHSPSQRPKAGDKHTRPASMLRPSDSSFGLHSPDVLPASVTNQEDLIKRLQDDPSLPFAEGTLYLDPDIIDLTMIPPPITPEEDGIKLPLTISEPPTPFADRESLENELKNPLGIDMPDLGELRDLTDLAQWSDVLSDSANDSKEDLTSLESSSKFSQSADFPRKRTTSHDPELERLLTKMAVPPPPPGGGKINVVPEINEDLSAYIIPPPPSTTNNLKAMAILQKLNAAREGIFQVMHGDSSEVEEEKDCGVAEVRIRSEQRERTANPAPKTGLFSSVITEKTTPDLSPSSSHSSGYGSLKSIVDITAPELPARVPKSGPLTPKKNGFVGSSSWIGRGLITAQEEEDDDDIPPPPPPPRISSQRNSGTMQRSPVKAKPANPPPPPPGVLVKSSSQGNLLEKRPAAERLLPKKMSAPHLPAKVMSMSSESLSVSQSPSTTLSPSKLSITSSNDSLSSNTSVATVKAANPASSGDTTPPLPPRGSPTRVVMRPPLPASHSLETVKTATSRGLASPTSTRRAAAAAADVVIQKPPSLPSRLRKPGPPVVPKSSQKPTKSAAPPPPVVQQPAEVHYAVPHSSKIPISLKNNPASLNGSPVKDTMVSGSPLRDFKDFTLSPKRQMEASGGGRAAPPLLTSSPKMNTRHNAATIGSNVISVSIQPDKQVNGRVNTDGSVDSGSFEQDSLDGGAEVDLVVLCSQSEATINRVIARLVIPGDGANQDLEDRDVVESARDRLINESRHFVTASKMFVKSVTESAEAMSTCLSQCVSLIERMAEATDPLTHSHMGRDLIPKVRDVSRAFLHTVRAAAEAFGQGATDPSMGRLMSKATALAGVLTILMRSLRP